jgi:hypothetical protein
MPVRRFLPVRHVHARARLAKLAIGITLFFEHDETTLQFRDDPAVRCHGLRDHVAAAQGSDESHGARAPHLVGLSRRERERRRPRGRTRPALRIARSPGGASRSSWRRGSSANGRTPTPSATRTRGSVSRWALGSRSCNASRSRVDPHDRGELRMARRAERNDARASADLWGGATGGQRGEIGRERHNIRHKVS